MTLTQSPQVMFAIYVAVFIGVLLVYEGVRQLLHPGETGSETKNRRMRMIKRGVSDEDILDILRDPSLQKQHKSRSLIAWLRHELSQAGLAVSPYMVIVAMIALWALLFWFGLRYVDTTISAIVSAILAIGLPLLTILAFKQSRAEKLTAQMPDALDLMARGLRIGHPISVTVASVATNMPDPIGTEFGIIQDQINFGDDIATAFHDFAERVDTEDARYLAVSVSIQHGTGGNLARVLEVLSQVIRDRFVMRKRIKAISSEGRLSGLILTVLPVGIFLSIHLTTPSFYGDVQADPLFKPFAIAICTLIVAQGLILRRLINFKF